MSTPSTATAVHPTHFYPHSNSDYQNYLRKPSPQDRLSRRLAYANPNAGAGRARGEQHIAQRTRDPDSDASIARADEDTTSSAMAASRDKRKANWHEFYKNGIPKEVIVIDDDSPEPAVPTKRRRPSPERPSQTYTSNGVGRPADKKRKTDAYDTYENIYSKPGASLAQSTYTEESPNSTGSASRTTVGVVSTAPTSMGSNSSGGQRLKATASTLAGTKRKRSLRNDTSEREPVLEIVNQTSSWSAYVPPPKPPIKAQDVYVALIRDKPAGQTTKCDDDDGHYIVSSDSELTERYTITRLLGQGTFGKVVEAFDRKKNTKCAVKIIRAVPKYRDASRIELRVLATLASNDRYNRNKCIHLRDCFDFRNHICIVTDLLSSSVFDFLKANSFTPFPSTHIQSFARQLFTSVAFLHDLNLIHTDLKPENILLVDNRYQTFTYGRCVPASSKNTSRHAKLRKVLLDPEIRLIDFGSATFDDEYHSTVVSTRHYRAPEIILNLGWSFPCDIWSIGCILIEFFTGDALFQTHDNLEHLAMMEAVCGGRIEKELVDKVRIKNGTKNQAADYFKQRGYALDFPLVGTTRSSKKYVRGMKTLDETITPNTPFNGQFLDLLRKIFVYDPRKRITAKEALHHPWFKESLADDGTEALKIRLSRDAAPASG